jgi:hypothetical protein
MENLSLPIWATFGDWLLPEMEEELLRQILF